MKKILVSILILASINTIGCNDTMVLEENTKEVSIVKGENEKTDIIEDFDIKEVPVDIENNFIPRVYINDKVLGTNISELDKEKEITYSLTKDGEVTKYEDENFLVLNNYANCYYYNYYGVTERKEKVKNTTVSQYYYVDKMKNIEFKLDGFNTINLKYQSQGTGYGDILQGNDNYYVIYFSKYSGDFYSQYSSEGSEQQVLLIDIKNEKMYLKEENDMKNGETFIASMYYDENLNCIMALTYDGKIKKVSINNDKIQLKDYKDINLQGYKICYKYGGMIDNRGIDNKVILEVTKNRKDEKFTSAIYDIKSNELVVLEEGLNIHNIMGKNNLVNVIYKDEPYIAQIREDNTINYLYKFGDDKNKYYSAYGVINEEGNSIFIKKYLNEAPEGEYSLKEEYSFLKLIAK